MNDISYLIGIVRGLILPPQSLFLLLALGLLLHRWSPRLGRNLGAAAVVLLFMLSTPAVANLFVEPLERFAAPLESPYGTGAQAIVVLAAGRLANAPEYDDSDIPDYIALARLRYAAKLQRQSGLPVLVSGGDGQRRESYAIGMARALRDEFQIPVRWIEGESYNTDENAKFSARILQKDGVSRILLVTDAMHMPRSVMAFTQIGLKVVPAPTMFFSSADLHPSQFFPTAEGLRRSHYALYEWIGILWYWIKYRDSGSTHVDLIVQQREIIKTAH
jgi:uncharacterized SAM-binding protein YcdF (DUF218 family)